MSLMKLFEFTKIFKEEEENLSIFTDDEDNDESMYNYSLAQKPRRLKVTRLKPILKRALLDLKQKGRIDTGDANLNIFLKFFLNEDPKKTVLLVDNFLALAKLMKGSNPPKLMLEFDSDNEIGEIQKDLAKEQKDKLLSLKLQSIDEVIRRTERVKKRRDGIK
jgi:hypothetical protein